MTTTPSVALTGDPQRILTLVATLLDQVARSTDCAVVTLHVTAAFHCIPAVPTDDLPPRSNDRDTLHAALGLFAELPASALSVTTIADAAHHTLLAYLATR